ncbi:MAG: M81 family metallopeptidase [Pseudomonadota bacterium]
MTRTVLVAGLFHETHTFLAETTGMSEFESGIVRFGQEVIENARGDGSPMDGFLSYAEDGRWSLIPSVQMAAMPSGLVEDEVVEVFEARLFDDLESSADKLDGIFLVLHGAMVSQSRDDVEGAVLASLKSRLAALGRDIPIVAVLDLHANVSQTMVDNSTALTAYRENPHSDARETAIRGATMLDALFDGRRPTQIHSATPYVIPPVGQGTDNEPMKSVLARARAIEAADPDIFAINVMAGYAYADIADCGFSLNCMTYGDRGRALDYLWELQQIAEVNLASAYPRDDPLDRVLEKCDALPPGKGPILLIEPADNIGGGTPGDATGILGPLLKTGRRSIVAAINDPASVQACVRAGQGAIVALSVGAKTDRHHGTPVPFEGIVRNLTDGKFELENPRSHMASMRGTRIDMGPCAVVTNDQATILLTTHKTAPMDLGHLHSQGIRPEDASYVIVKAAVSHKDAYDPIARASFYVDSEGLCTSNLTRLPYKKLAGKQISLFGAGPSAG